MYLKIIGIQMIIPYNLHKFLIKICGNGTNARVQSHIYVLFPQIMYEQVPH